METRVATKERRMAAQDHFLLEVANLLASNLEGEALFQTIAQILRRALKIDRASLTIYDRERDEFEVVALAIQAESKVGRGFVVPHRGSRVGRAFDTRRPFLSGALGKGEPYYEDARLLAEDMHTGLTVPLIVGSTPIGTFNVNCHRESALDEIDVELLTRIADQIAIAVANSRSFEAVRREKAALQREKDALLRSSELELPPAELLALRPSFRAQLERLATLGKVDATVLITGETGTGKGLIARALHEWSPRRSRSFVKCDCAALAPSLIESELFGHEKGAFTGAHSRHLGRFEVASGGTLFLDEIAEMSLETQTKLLSVLEDREIRRVGGADVVGIDIRVIAATHRDLEEEVAAGRFRQDLYYRLDVLSLAVPPLRECREDIEPLAEYFIARFNRAFGRSVGSLRADALVRMKEYVWPGNVRELANMIERAVLLSSGRELELHPELMGESRSAARPSRDVDESLLTLEEVERRHIWRVLERTSWRINGAGGAAELLGLHPNTLRSRMARLGIRRNPRTSASS